jgi:fructoselysine-6-P-deglycase FrlB-like protein
MGKPYQLEVAALPKTISWALSLDIKTISSFISEVRGTSLITTGSGGSLSAAKLASIFHQLGGAGFSKSATPLELTSLDVFDKSASFLLLSAGGANNDIRMVFRHLASKSLRRFATITGCVETPISRLARRYPDTTCVELDVPSGRDGFLATNSLMAFTVVLARAYVSAFGTNSTFSSLRSLNNKALWKKHVEALDAATRPLWERKHLIVLFSPDLEAAATDIESKFTEAALGTTQIADYRHFAHGRHHWLAKQGENCGVLAFFTPRFQQIAEKTLGYLPKSVPVVKMPFSDDIFEAGASAMLASILLAGFAGRERNIDPGRPGVPGFGRKIYHLRWAPSVTPLRTKYRHIEVAIDRKVEAIGKQPNDSELFSGWLNMAQTFCTRLGKQSLKALVFDYDGTMVATNCRFGPIPKNVAAPLVYFLRKGIVVGVASGRGKSLRKVLRETIPVELQSRVVVGYYNGSQTGLLTDDSIPAVLPVECELAQIQKKLASAAALRGNIEMEARHKQLSVVPLHHLRVEELWRVVSELLSADRQCSFRVFCSGHSIDIIAPTTTKRSVIEQVKALSCAEDNEVLCIGDKGRWPGNDSELLSRFPSLSVDEVSTESDTCWNLAPPGISGSEALAAYFASMKVSRKGIVLDPTKIKRQAK